MLLARREDFEPATPEEGEQALYYNREESTGYGNFEYFDWRIDAIKELFPPNRQTVAVLGCGWGFLVTRANYANYNCVGIDFSDYAISKKVTDRVIYGNALTLEDHYDIIITEDLLPCLTNEEIQEGLTMWRACSEHVVHIVTPWSGDSRKIDLRLNWKIPEWWARLLEPDIVMDMNARIIP